MRTKAKSRKAGATMKGKTIWQKPSEFVDRVEYLTSCFVIINGQVCRSHTVMKPFNDAGFNVYHYDNFSESSIFFSHDDERLSGAALDYGQEMPEVV